MRIEEAASRRLLDARKDAGLTQTELGQEIGKLLGHAWSRQSVSAAENGGRSFTLAELVALSLILGVPVGYFALPPDDEAEIELAPDRRIDAGPLRGGHEAGHADETVRKLVRSLAELRQKLPQAERILAQSVEQVEELAFGLHFVAVQRGIDSGGALLDLPAREKQ